MTFRVTFIAAALSGFLYGYNIGVYSGAILEIGETFGASDTALGNLIALFEFAEIFGVCLSFLADRFGRRRTLIFACIIMCVAPALQLIQSSFTALLIAGGLSGISAGYIFVIALVFVSEITPKSKRPFMLSTVMVGLTSGYMVELGVIAELATDHHWRLAITFGAFPALIQLIGLITMKESPAFLLPGTLQITFTFGIRTTVFQLLPRLFSDPTRAVGVALYESRIYTDFRIVLRDRLDPYQVVGMK